MRNCWVKKIGCLLVLAFAVVFVLSTFVLLGHHCDHHEECIICSFVEVVERGTSAVAASASVFLLVPVARTLFVEAEEFAERHNTPVSLKVKLSD